MTRRLIWIVVAVAVVGGLGFLAYDRYLGSEFRQGQQLRDALAAELASDGFAFTSMEYDWRARRVIAKDLVATRLPEGVTAFTIGEAVYRGADPATIRAALADREARRKRRELIADLTLSKVVVGFKDGTEFKQDSLSLKKVSLGKAIERDVGSSKAMAADPLLRAADFARRLHVRLLEAKDAHLWYPAAQTTYDQALLRLEDYRAGNFSEFRLEGMNLVAAVAARVKLDEFFIQSVKARRFLDQLHRTPLYASLVAMSKEIESAFAGSHGDALAGGGGETAGAKASYPSAAESAIIAGDQALIGFEALIPAVGRIAFDEISTTGRQYLNGFEVGGTSKVVDLELQFNTLTQVLTAGLDRLGVNLASVAADAGEEVETWLANHAGNAVDSEGPVTAALKEGGRGPVPEADGKGREAGRTPAGAAQDKPAAPETVTTSGAGAKRDVLIPLGPKDGQVEQGPAAPVAEVWRNKIKPPSNAPDMNNRQLAEIIRKLGFDDLRIDSEWVAGFDGKARVWELSKYTFDIGEFWNLAATLRLSGMAALAEVGRLPIHPEGWWQTPEAGALGGRFLKEGRFEGLSFTYRDRGFLKRLMALIAEMQETTVEALATKYVDEMFSAKDGAPLLQADGLADAIRAFLIAPDVFSIRFAPADPVPLGAFPEMDKQRMPLPEMAGRLGMVLTFNNESFANFKKSAPIGSDIQSEQH